MNNDEKNAPVWRLEDHLCRVCFGRLVSRPLLGGGRNYRCTCCGESADGQSHDVLCACGMKSERGADLGVRCMVNDQRSPEIPHEIVARPIALAKEG